MSRPPSRPSSVAFRALWAELQQHAQRHSTDRDTLEPATAQFLAVAKFLRRAAPPNDPAPVGPIDRLLTAMAEVMNGATPHLFSPKRAEGSRGRPASVLEHFRPVASVCVDAWMAAKLTAADSAKRVAMEFTRLNYRLLDGSRLEAARIGRWRADILRAPPGNRVLVIYDRLRLAYIPPGEVMDEERAMELTRH